MTSAIVPQVVAALGDSLTLGGTGDELKCWPARLDVDTRFYPNVTVANFGKAGDRSDQMSVRYQQTIKGKGFAGLVVKGCVNDNVQDVSSATTTANLEALISDAIADHLPVGLVITPSFGASVNWSAPRQTKHDAVKAYMLAQASRSGVAFVVDLTLASNAGGLSDPNNLNNLDPALSIGEGEHENDAGDALEASILAPHILAMVASSAIVTPFVEAVTLPIPNAGQYKIKRGDLRPSVRMALKSRDGSPLPLPAGSTVTFRMRVADAAPGTLKVNSAAVIEDRANAVVRYDWQGSDTDTNGFYLGEFRRVVSGAQETVPGDSFLGINVVDPA